MRTGASLRAKKMTGLRAGHFFTLRSARRIFGRAKLARKSANSARIRLIFEFDANYFAAGRRNLSEAFQLSLSSHSFALSMSELSVSAGSGSGSEGTGAI